MIKPNKGEKKEEFFKRGMEDESMIEKYPEEKERQSACGSAWKSKKDSAESRVDFYDSSEWMKQKFTTTPEGYLKGRAPVTNIGVFRYIKADGKIQRELRLPEEVFAQDSLDTIKMKPLTNNHPKERVTSENIKKYDVGSLGSDIYTDPYQVSTDICIKDQQTILDVQAGKRSLSCGYDCDIEETSGVWMGMEYDVIQRNIRYNHVAVVDKGRAGDGVVMNLDSDYNPLISMKEALSDLKDHSALNIDSFGNDGKKNGGNAMADFKKLNIDGVEYEAEAAVIHRLTSMTADNAEMKKTIDEAGKAHSDAMTKQQAVIDQLKADIDDLKKKLDEAEKADPKKLDAMVQEKLVLLDAAKQVEVEVKADADNLSIKKEIIKKLYPVASEKIDSADEVYVNARFDVALESLSERKDKKDKVDQVLKNDATPAAEKATPAEAYKRMTADAESAWKREVK